MRFNIGISDYNTEEGLSPKRLLTFSFLTLKRVFLIFFTMIESVTHLLLHLIPDNI